MKTLLILLLFAPALWALDDPTYPIHENGEYLCYRETPSGLKCELWLFGPRVDNDRVQAYKLRRFGRFLGGATATSGAKPVGEYEKEPVLLDLRHFNYLRLMRIRRERPASTSSLHCWTRDEHFRFTNRETSP